MSVIPASWTQVPVTWSIFGNDGTPCNGWVMFTTSQIVTVDGTTFVPSPILAHVTSGVMDPVSLPATDDPDVVPNGWTWSVVTGLDPDGPEPFLIQVPAATVGSINLATVLPVVTPPAVERYAPLDGTGKVSDGYIPDGIARDAEVTAAAAAAVAAQAAIDAATYETLTHATASYSPLVTSVDSFAAYGDSFTVANQDGETSWVTTLGTDLGTSVFMGGVSGMCSSDIAIRQGGLIPLITLPSNQIPATTGAVTVTVSPTTAWRSGQTVAYTGTLAGIPGTLTRNGSDGTWTFARTTAGSVVAAPAGSPFTIDDAAGRRGWVQWLEAGRNNLDPVSGDSTTLALAVRDLDYMARYLTAAGNKRYFVPAIPRSLADDPTTTNYALIKKVNGWLSSRHGTNYLDWQQWMIANGLTLAGITPTPTDRGNLNTDNIPTSLRAAGDNLHLSATGYSLMKDYLKDQMAQRGYRVGQLPVAAPATPVAPTGGTATGSTVPLTLTAVTGATAYRVEMKKTSAADTDYTTVANTTGTSVTVSALDSGTSYDFRVYAVNVGGSSAASPKVSVATTGTPPPVVASDSFNRTATTSFAGSSLDNALGGSSSLVWGAGTTFHMGIDANGYIYNANTASAGFCLTDSGSSDQRAAIRVKQLGGFNSIYARWTSNSSCYAAVMTATGGINIQRNFGTGVVVLWPTTNGLVKNGDVVALSVIGSTLTLYINNVQVAQVTDANVTTGTKWGVTMGTDPNARLDEFILSQS